MEGLHNLVAVLLGLIALALILIAIFSGWLGFA